MLNTVREFDEEPPVKMRKKGLKPLIRVCTEKGLDDLGRQYRIIQTCFSYQMKTGVPTSLHIRKLFGFADSSRTKEYSENKVLGFTMEQLYDVVANVDDYKYFVPWCRSSTVFEKSEMHARADLEVGFPPVIEKYTSVLTLARPNLVKSECMDGSLFNHLSCHWKISNGPQGMPDSCTLNFYVSFEFKSIFHSQLSSLFFDEVVRKMVKAFESRCVTLYGASSFDRSRMEKRALLNRRKLHSALKYKPKGR